MAAMRGTHGRSWTSCVFCGCHSGQVEGRSVPDGGAAGGAVLVRSRRGPGVSLGPEVSLGQRLSLLAFCETGTQTRFIFITVDLRMSGCTV